ncbi:MAG: hypothetical protein M3137_01840 [Actinomycetota bacterium]|nr:hypothetical protein [Actinomycetota bacterium]
MVEDVVVGADDGAVVVVGAAAGEVAGLRPGIVGAGLSVDDACAARTAASAAACT